MNHTSSAFEVWGYTAELDDLPDFFSKFYVENDLIDILPVKMRPTWSNGRCGRAGVHKRLDRFLIKSEFLVQFQSYRTWVYETKFSDHWPIVLQLDDYGQRHSSPFNFNNSWLNDDQFCIMVKDFWLNYRG